VPQALYQAILKFDGTEPRFVKTVQLVNLNRGVTYWINKEFAGGLAECRKSVALRCVGLQSFKNR